MKLMDRRHFLAMGGLVATMLAAGCSRARVPGTPTLQGLDTNPAPGPTPGPAPSELRADLARRRAGDPAAAGAGLADCAVRLFGAAAPGTDNAVISPYSILTALGMTQYAARGEAAAAMTSVLGGDADTVAGWLTVVDDSIAAAVARGVVNASGESVDTVVDAANSLFAHSDLQVRQEFLNQLATGYGAGLRTCDFIADPERCRALINDWVADRTHDLIQQLLPAGIVDADTRMLLVNALYLSASWDTEFTNGGPVDFAAPGGPVSVRLMGMTRSTAHATGNRWQSVSVPYAGRGLAMTILLPDAGAFNAVVAGLNGAVLHAAAAGSHEQIALRMPAFSATTAVSMDPALTAMGLGPIFGGDMSGITGRAADVTVGSVLHRAKIDVDEHGTKAAAATAVIGIPGAAPGPQGPDPIEVTVDRPFLYSIHDTATRCPLFLGRVSDPTKLT